MESNKDIFKFTYSAKQQDEIKRIRKKYITDDSEDKLEKLRRLDRSVVSKANLWSIVLGVIGALVLGTGMSCAMVWGDKLMILGIIIGVLGIILVSLAYPVYMLVLKKERERIAPEILRLTDELMK
ncbi:MAG: hypothetical protein IJC81_02080 [Clostridia bacterium]|nr:hypothetical protein [Clostridia bacterium]